MLNKVRKTSWRKTQLWGLYKTQDGSGLDQAKKLYVLLDTIFVTKVAQRERIVVFSHYVFRSVGG